MSTPHTYYVVLGTPRTGSNLLCEYLTLSNHAGKPTEYFNPELHIMENHGFRLEQMDEFVAQLKEQFTVHETFGFKLFWGHFQLLIRGKTGSFKKDEASYRAYWAILNDYFPSLEVIRATRHDKLRQAISMVKARQTEQWSSKQEAVGKLVYNAADLLYELKRLNHQEQVWDRFLSINEIEAFPVVYEDLQCDPQKFTHEILESVLGHEIDPALLQYEEQELQRQSDELSDQWYAQLVQHITQDIPWKKK